MIVDDEIEARDDMLACIDWHSNGMFVVGTADDGMTAYEMIIREKPDIVLIDIQMPGMNGLQVIERIQNEYETSPAFIIISGYDDFSFAQQAIHLSVDEYLLKPFLPDDVLRAINKSIKRIETFRRLSSDAQEKSFFSFYCDCVERDTSPDKKQQMSYPIDEERALINSLQIGLQEETLSLFDLFFDKAEKNNKKQSTVINCCLMLYMEVYRLLLERKLELSKNFFTSVSVHDGRVISSLKESFREIVIEAYGLLNSKKESNFLISRAVKYIENHYYEKLSLDSVAKEMFVSPPYLSSLFKQTLSINFIDYVHSVRIENAKRLLSTTNQKNYEIAEQVGYTDSKYFSQVFKKLTGLTPMQFREQSEPYLFDDVTLG